ncbi:MULTISPECIES: alpha/beta fold hydrolase [unclassified Arthrobacter]|uniref:alpha/beta fold hydrolase n=1 Tax=unclassified Arthrobacter TaxID=235627 RepID=UPI00159E4778|nr:MULTISPECIES: alpha/beta hydrolase [unclassified Arthrobacter]MCQ9163811.1 alpha/beta hydrolase [Arthrobacter sp. STN4]NVM99404.1 alpha/beta hydrolase [Arthrobacter sp. SDTb3-6]
MSSFATSRDGTRIAYDIEGSGPPVILVAGAMQFRGFDPTTSAMAALLARQGFTVVNYDRRGRGESAQAPSFTLADSIADLRALVEAAGAPAALYGNSSGGAIALAAAAAGLPVSALVLWEVPLGEELGTDGAANLAGLREQLAEGTPDDVVSYFMKDMPPEWLDGARNSPAWPVMTAMGPSLEPDAEALAWTQSAPRADLWASITAPTLALVGEQTLPIMPPAAASIAANVPNAGSGTIRAANHSWEPETMASRVAGFLNGRP